MGWILDILQESWRLYYVAAPFILFGVFMAGVLQVLLSPKHVVKWMGRPGMSAVCRSALLGIPLPLCSCGVFPVSISLRRKGATAPSTMSFLVTTPETSIDAIALTYALLGPVMAVFRPLAAFFTGGLAGALAIAVPPGEPDRPLPEEIECGSCSTGSSGTSERKKDDTRGRDGHDEEGEEPGAADRVGDDHSDFHDPDEVPGHSHSPSHDDGHDDSHDDDHGHSHSHDLEDGDYVGARAFGRAIIGSFRKPGSEGAPEITLGEVFSRIGRQAFIRSMDDIVFWLTLGLILAGVIEVLVPEDLISSGLGSGLLPMIFIVLVAIPMYTCASASTPIAAALVAKGLSPGAALVFLLAGPAASTASMLLINRHFGGRFLRIYVSAVVVGSILSGLALDALLNRFGWTIDPVLSSEVEGLAAFLQLACVVFLTVLIIWRLWAGGFRAGLAEGKENIEALGEILVRSGIGGFGSAGGGDARDRRFRLSSTTWIVIAAVVVVGYLASGFTTVLPSSAGYRKIFGEITARDLDPGLHWAPPAPFGNIEVWRTHYPRKSDIGFATSLEAIARRKQLRSQAPPNEWHSPVTAMNADPRVTSYMTGDQNLVEMSFTVHYFLSDAYAFLYDTAKDRDLVGLYAETTARELVGSRTLDRLLTAERNALEADIHSHLQSRLDNVGLGVRINGVHLVDIHPPQGAVTAFRDVSSAREDEQTRIHQALERAAEEIPLARGAAALDVAREEAEASGRVADATGQAQGYMLRSEAFRRAPKVLEHLLWLETAERVLAGRRLFIVPPGSGSGNVTFWEIDPPLPPNIDEGGF